MPEVSTSASLCLLGDTIQPIMPLRKLSQLKYLRVLLLTTFPYLVLVLRK